MAENATIYLFHCVNSVTDSELRDLQAGFGADGLRVLSLPCSGKITVPYLLKAFEKGADGAVICTCPASQCKHLEGNLRASKRAEVADELLDEIGVGKGRVLVVTKEQGQIEKLVEGIQRLQAVCGAPVRTYEETPYGVTTNEPGRTILSASLRAGLAGVRPGQRRENAA